MSILDALGLLLILVLIPLTAYLALDFVREGEPNTEAIGDESEEELKNDR